jgi:hypothetical protein
VGRAAEAAGEPGERAGAVEAGRVVERGARGDARAGGGAVESVARYAQGVLDARPDGFRRSRRRAAVRSRRNPTIVR